MTDAPEPGAAPEAEPADALEQATPVEEVPSLDTRRLADLPVEANEADVLEQAQGLPDDPDELP